MSSNNPYQKYFSELEDLVDKIINGKPESKDFDRLVHLLKLGGLSERTVNSLYKNCNFKSWDDYYDAKRGICSADELLMVDCVEDKLKGALSSMKLVFRNKLLEIA